MKLRGLCREDGEVEGRIRQTGRDSHGVKSLETVQMDLNFWLRKETE